MATQTILETAHRPSKEPEEIELQPVARSIEAARSEGEGRAVDEGTRLTRQTFLKVIAASISFFFAGNNDGSLGTLIPYILRTYNVGTEYVALM